MQNNLRHYKALLSRYTTLQNVTAGIALAIAVSWVWSTVGALQKNFYYQKQVDELALQVELEKLRNENLAFQQKYYRSEEYLELSARQRLGKANPGEKLVILPNSREIKDTVQAPQTVSTATPSNFSQWMRFLFGEK